MNYVPIKRPVRPQAAVHFEGTITEGADITLRELGRLRPGVKEQLEALQKTHNVIIVSAFAKDKPGRERVLRFLRQHCLTYWEIWTGFGYPEAAVRYDNGALLLMDGALESTHDAQ